MARKERRRDDGGVSQNIRQRSQVDEDSGRGLFDLQANPGAGVSSPFTKHLFIGHHPRRHGHARVPDHEPSYASTHLTTGMHESAVGRKKIAMRCTSGDRGGVQHRSAGYPPGRREAEACVCMCRFLPCRRSGARGQTALCEHSPAWEQRYCPYAHAGRQETKSTESKSGDHG
jgi:hypothetical protein